MGNTRIQSYSGDHRSSAAHAHDRTREQRRHLDRRLGDESRTGDTYSVGSKYKSPMQAHEQAFLWREGSRPHQHRSADAEHPTRGRMPPAVSKEARAEKKKAEQERRAANRAEQESFLNNPSLWPKNPNNAARSAKYPPLKAC